jgi:deoxyribodipyrimidine photo-lyase
MNRRVDSNHALAHAATIANDCKLPLLFYEGLTCSYPHANDRLHTFLLEGVPETARRLRNAGIGYVFHLRRRKADPDDALYRLAGHAAVIVTDNYPAFITRRHNASVPEKVDIPYHAVDASCVVPMSLFEKREYAAYTIRPKIRRLLPKYLKPAPFAKVDREFTAAAGRLHTEVTGEDIRKLVTSCEIDHDVPASVSIRGGRLEAERRLDLFLKQKLRRYAAGRHDLIDTEFLEELIVRRELAFNFARHTPNPDSLDTLPDWVRKTLKKHQGQA